MSQHHMDEYIPAGARPIQPGAPVHDFRRSLAASEAGSLEPFWDDVYRAAFDNLVACVPLRGDTQSQRQGKDRLLHLANGRTLYIDEKIRPDRTNDSDILLEYKHEGRYNAPGWIEQDKDIDYIAYAFVKLKRVYLFPWLELRRAWLQNKYEWLAMYQLIQARNRDYITYSVPVETRLLRGKVAGAGKIQL